MISVSTYGLKIVFLVASNKSDDTNNDQLKHERQENKLFKH